MTEAQSISFIIHLKLMSEPPDGAAAGFRWHTKELLVGVCSAPSQPCRASHSLCKPLSALTSCLTPPHPVDNCFFLLLLLLPAHRLGSRCVIPGDWWQGNSQDQPILSFYRFAHWGEKNKTDETRWRKKIKCLFQIIVWDNRAEWG